MKKQEWQVRTSNKRCRYRTRDGKCKISIDYNADCEYTGCIMAID